MRYVEYYFFIGNGFDINIGLATRYSNFYPYFLRNANDNNMIKSWLDGNEKLWSDLEEKLGQEISKIPEGKLEQFYDDKDELDRLLKEPCEKGLLQEYDSEVYFIPKTTTLSSTVGPNADMVARYRFISKGDNVDGFYADNTFANQIGISAQVP